MLTNIWVTEVLENSAAPVDEDSEAVSLFVPLSDDIECGPSAQRWITCMGPRTGLFHRITKTVYFGKKRKISCIML